VAAAAAAGVVMTSLLRHLLVVQLAQGLGVGQVMHLLGQIVANSSSSKGLAL
jgi:hypothetical protein